MMLQKKRLQLFCSFFVDVDITDNKLAKKIREAQLEQCVSCAVTFH